MTFPIQPSHRPRRGQPPRQVQAVGGFTQKAADNRRWRESHQLPGREMGCDVEAFLRAFVFLFFSLRLESSLCVNYW